MRTTHTLALVLLLTPATALAEDKEHDTSNFGANKEADLNKREEKTFGGHSGRFVLYAFHASGENFTRIPVATPTPNPNPTPATPGTPATPTSKSYSRNGALAEVHFGGNADKTRFKTLLGFEVNAAFGYGTLSYSDGVNDKDGDSENTGSLIARLEGAPNFGLLDFGGEKSGARFTFIPAMGCYLDGGRFYDSYCYFSLGARVSAHLSEKFDTHLQYVFVPGTTSGGYKIREHRLEASGNLDSFAFGARFQLDSVSSENELLSSSNPTFGLFGGLAF